MFIYPKRPASLNPVGYTNVAIIFDRFVPGEYILEPFEHALGKHNIMIPPIRIIYPEKREQLQIPILNLDHSPIILKAITPLAKWAPIESSFHIETKF